MHEHPRYTIDSVGDLEWSLFDESRRGQPHNYFLYVIQVGTNSFAHQLILTVFNAATSAEYDVPVFEREIYSTFFFAAPSAIEGFVLEVYENLLDMEIDNPVGLAYLYGGTVNNEAPRMYPWYRPN